MGDDLSEQLFLACSKDAPTALSLLAKGATQKYVVS
jgi:hypothetical protein